ncbi:hypothetical protein [Pseudokineococcus sp. 1T1Z-3]|uniref:hypothetical protein n=1 Tax=Pseudokineococcus sp. 1T1Z-3 TaxID=3132745 RepID=UPI0030990D29
MLRSEHPEQHRERGRSHERYAVYAVWGIERRMAPPCVSGRPTVDSLTTGEGTWGGVV